MKKSMWSSGISTELQCCQTLQLTSEAEGRMKVSGEKKKMKKKKVYFFKGRSPCIRGFPEGDSLSSEHTISTSEHLVQYSPTVGLHATEETGWWAKENIYLLMMF